MFWLQFNLVVVRLLGSALSEMNDDSISTVDRLLLTLNDIATWSSKINQNISEKNGNSMCYVKFIVYSATYNNAT